MMLVLIGTVMSSGKRVMASKSMGYEMRKMESRKRKGCLWLPP
jgi:hypothetical protein